MTDPLTMLEVSIQDHQLTVLRDADLYRHIRLAKPGTGIWRFDLITWPGHLVITGDLEDLHFARDDDMFEFFRSPAGLIKPQYWAEKLRGPVRVREYSPQKAKQRVTEYFLQRRGQFAGHSADLWRDIRREVFAWDVLPYEDVMRAALRDFEFVAVNDIEPAGPARDFVPQRMPKRYGDTFEFTDPWDWDLSDWDFHYLVALHAIVWGINTYDRSKVASVRGQS